MANWAIVIGVDHYPASPDWTLRGAVRDAVAMRRWLLDTRGGNVPPENLVLLLDPRPGDEIAKGLEFKSATYDNIVTSTQKLLKDSAARGERLFFHFSGHGLAIPTDLAGKEGTLASDFSDDIPTHSITIDSLFGRFQATHFREQFFFIDACRNMPFETARLGQYPHTLPPVSPVSPQFVMYATQRGATAQEIGNAGDESGAFTDALLKGLKGAGAAKAWDEEKEEYVVRWNALVAAVVHEVREKRLRADANPGGPLIQEPKRFGERGDEDPELGRFPKEAFPNEKLSIALVPSPKVLPVASIRISELAGLAKELHPPIATVPVVADLPPRIYAVRGQAPGYKPTSVVKVKLYRTTSITLTFEEDSEMPSAGAAAMRTDSSMPASFGGPDAAPDPVFPRHSIPDLPRESPGPSSGLNAKGGIEATAPEPLALVQIANESGKILRTQRGNIRLSDLPFGFYTLRIISPEGAIVAEAVETPKPNGIRKVELAVPDSRSPAMAQLIEHVGWETRPDGTISPSETVGPTAFLKLSTVLALAIAAGLENDPSYGNTLRKVPVPRFHDLVGGESACGLYLVFGDEHHDGFWDSVEAYDSAGAGRLTPDPASDNSRLLRALAWDAPPGDHMARIVWRGQEALIPYHVLPGRVTIFVLTRELDGAIEMHQYMPLSGVGDPGAVPLPDWKKRDPFFSRSAFAAIRRIEYMQRSFAKGRITPLQPDIELLLFDKWADPIAGCLGAYLAERMGTVEGVDVATANLVRYFGELPDAHILRGAHLRRAGRTIEAQDEFSAAIRAGVPVFRDGSVLLSEHVQTLPFDARTKDLAAWWVRYFADGAPWNMELGTSKPRLEFAFGQAASTAEAQAAHGNYLDASP